MKNIYKIVAIVLAVVVLAGGAYKMYSSKTSNTSTEESSNKESTKDESSLSKGEVTPSVSITKGAESSTSPTPTKPKQVIVRYQLADGKKLIVYSIPGFSLEVAQSSSPEDVVVSFENGTITNESPWFVVVTKEFAHKQVDKVGFAHNYGSTLKELMAFYSANQCSMLKPGDFKVEKIGNYTVDIGKRVDDCGHMQLALNMYGFETNGFYVVVMYNDDKGKLPKDLDKIVKTLISNIEIK